MALHQEPLFITIAGMTTWTRDYFGKTLSSTALFTKSTVQKRRSMFGLSTGRGVAPNSELPEGLTSQSECKQDSLMLHMVNDKQQQESTFKNKNDLIVIMKI